MAELDLGKVVGRDGTIVKRNLLDNSDFRNPVNQRGKSSYTANGYTIDRWFNQSDATTTVNSGSITVTGLIMQRLLSAAKGGVYTLAVCNAGGDVMILDTHGWDNDASCYYVEFGNGEYVWAALYEGEYTAETLPEYVPKGYAAELMECMRYYQTLPRLTMPIPTGETVIPGRQFYMPMRIPPTIHVYDDQGAASAVTYWDSNAGLTHGVTVSQVVAVGNSGIKYLHVATAATSVCRATYYVTASADL